jgi:LDH2 family malate/lactate/ureidoglycolate dehydrogenase
MALTAAPGQSVRSLPAVEPVPPAPGVDEVFFPGEIEARAARDNLDRGLALPRQTLEDLRELARSTGVPPL